MSKNTSTSTTRSTDDKPSIALGNVERLRDESSGNSKTDSRRRSSRTSQRSAADSSTATQRSEGDLGTDDSELSRGVKDDDDVPVTHHTIQTDTGFELHVRSKRGTGTRDEDKVSMTVNKGTLEEIAAVHDSVIDTVKDTMRELRDYDPDSTDEPADSEGDDSSTEE